MGRAPCCEKMGLKKGPWTPQEDQILINYIKAYGHANWRALPKHAGLLRCGKSCRLRWTNYLRPDIKRGNFTKEEEDAIINLHDILGNRWSAIAARLPGRTDNEIKNVWHTHLKKRLPQNQQNRDPKLNKKQTNKLDVEDTSGSNQDAKQEQQEDPMTFAIHETKEESTEDRPLSPPQCSSDMSSLTTIEHNNSNITITNHDMSIDNNDHDLSINDDDNNNADSSENSLALDEDFWSEVLSSDNSNETSNFEAIGDDYQLQFPFSPPGTQEEVLSASSSNMNDGMEFWYDVYARAEEITQLLEL